MEIKILYEDNDIIVAVKPPKVPSQPDKTGDMDMVTFLENHTGVTGIGLIHRLDRPVGGIMVFGKSKQGTEGLNRCVMENLFQKTYFAVLCGVPKSVEGELTDYLIKNQKLNISKIVDEKTVGAKKAVLEYKVLKTITDEKYGKLSLVKINLKTGRHHQIRVQFAGINLPLWGDNKYNPMFIKNKGWTQIALWSGGLKFKHPVTGKNTEYLVKPTEGIFDLFDFDI